MGNISRTLGPRTDWPESWSGRLASKSEKAALDVRLDPQPAGPGEDHDALRAARGALLGVTLGALLWALILWLLL